MPKDLPPPELLRKLLRYEPETGKLFWRERPIDMFIDGYRSAKQVMFWWNKRFANSEAFTSVNSWGYRRGLINGKGFVAHRVIWALHYGEWPSGQIDHIDQKKLNNRIANLRVVSQSTNQRNMPMKANNTSGVTGVHRHKKNGRYYAIIRANGKSKHLGIFSCISAAAIVRKGAESKYGYSDKHGLAKTEEQTNE